MINEKTNLTTKYGCFLKKICPTDELYTWGMEYFSHLKNTGYKFTKENLDILSFEGKVYEQNIIKDLFKERTEVPIQEVFFYLLENSLQNIEITKTTLNLNKTGKVVCDGTFYFRIKKISLFDFQIPLKNLKKYFYPTVDMPHYIYSKELHSSFNTTKTKLIFFHELTHMFGVKYYNNYQFVQSGALLQFYNFNDKFNYTLKTCENRELLNCIDQGEDLLNEIFVEYLMNTILNTSNIEKNSNSKSAFLQKNTEEKYSLITKDKNFLDYSSSYFARLGQYMPFLSALMFNELNVFDYCLKIRQFKNIVNTYSLTPDINEEISKYLLKVFVDYILFLNKDKKDNATTSSDVEKLTKEIEKDIFSLTCFEAINLLLFATYNHSYEFPFYKSKNYFEALCLNLYRNKLEQDFKNETIEKDSKFFETINHNLTEMDKFIFGDWDEKIEYRDLKTGKTKTALLEKVGSIENLVRLYPKQIQFQEFNSLLLNLEKLIISLPKEDQKTAYSKLKFLEDQKKINKKYNAIQKVNIEKSK